MKRFIVGSYKLLLFVIVFIPVLCIDIWRGLKTGVALGRLDFENDIREQREAVQMELFRRSSYPVITPEEVLKNGK